MSKITILRNKKLIEEYRKGLKTVILCKLFKISRQRIYQILKKNNEIANKFLDKNLEK